VTTIADIRLLSQRKARGTYAIHPNAINDAGVLTVAVPDDYEVRVLHFTRHDSADRPTIVETVSVETLRQLQLSPDGTVAIGITDDDFYIFNNGRKTRFLTDRRLTYHSVALAGNSRFAYVASDLLMHGYAVGIGDTSNRLLWTKDLQQPTELVAISPNGKFIAVVGSAGEIIILSDGRDTLVTVHTGLFPISICIDNDANTAVVGRDMFDNQLKTKVTDATGEYRLIADIDGDPCGIALLPGGDMVAIPTAVDARSGKIVFAGTGQGVDAWELLIDVGCPSGIALSPGGEYLGVSTRDGAIYRFEVDSVLKSGTSADQAHELFVQELKIGNIAAVLADYCSKWVGNQTSDFANAAEHVARDLSAALTNLTLLQHHEFLQQLCGQSSKFMIPSVFTTAITHATSLHVRRAVETKTSSVSEQLDVLASIQNVTGILIVDTELTAMLQAYALSVGDLVFKEMSASIQLGNLDRASELAVKASQSGITSSIVHDLHAKVNLERTLQDANVRYDAKDFSGALFGYRKLLRWMPENREIRARIQFAEAMVSDSGLQDRFSRLE
jgi:hypothetical protein